MARFRPASKAVASTPGRSLPISVCRSIPKRSSPTKSASSPTLLDRRVRLNGAAFLNKYNDIILAQGQVCPESVLQAPCLRPDNIGSADVKGIELEAQIYPVEGFSIEGSLALARLQVH